MGGLIAFIQKVWHLYNSRLAFIQFQTGIYTTTHWHLYNNTLAFIQVMSLLRFLPNSSWHSAMNGMHNLNACHPWQSAAQFFFFLPKLFMALCHEWHVDKLNACCPWQSAAQFFFFLPKLFMALCHERHAESKYMPSMAECCPIFFFLPKLFMALCHE